MAKKTPEQQIIDEIVTDNKILSLKNKVMDKMRNYSLLSSISETCKFVAGPLLFLGITAFSSGWPLATGLAIMGSALTLLAVGVATGFSASRVSQGGSFDNLEINAVSTARHLAKELENKSIVISSKEYEQNCRADGKSWVQVTRPRMAPPMPVVET